MNPRSWTLLYGHRPQTAIRRRPTKNANAFSGNDGPVKLGTPTCEIVDIDVVDRRVRPRQSSRIAVAGGDNRESSRWIRKADVIGLSQPRMQ